MVAPCALLSAVLHLSLLFRLISAGTFSKIVGGNSGGGDSGGGGGSSKRGTKGDSSPSPGPSLRQTQQRRRGGGSQQKEAVERDRISTSAARGVGHRLSPAAAPASARPRAKIVDQAVEEILRAVSDARAEAAAQRSSEVQINILLSGSASYAIPPYLRKMRSGDRLVQELNSYRDGGGRWSERIVMEMFYHAATEGERSGDVGGNVDSEGGCDRDCDCDCPDDDGAKSSLTQAVGWNNPDVHVCDWEGITCGITTAGAGIGKFPYAVNKNCPCGSGPSTVEWKDCKYGMIELKLTDDEELEEESMYEPDEIDRRRRRRTIYCPPPMEQPPSDAITKIDLLEYEMWGTLAPELYNLKWLHRLNLNDNLFYGTIPSTYGWFENLHFIDLGENQLTGTIPSELSNITTLDELWLEKNRLTGTLPSELAKLTAEYLDVSVNELTGTLPTELGSMVKLGNAYLEQNQFSGSIPTELGWAPLKTLDLGSNRLIGSVPSNLGWMKDLVELNLSKNMLSGSLPDKLFSLPRLESMILSWNEITGDIPSDMKDEDDPFEDDDDYNIPDYIWTGVPLLEYLALDHNRFEGTLPPDMLLGISPTLRVLDFSDNELSGTLPIQIGLLKKLEKLHLSHNSFSGQIPSEIGELTHAQQINLTSNTFQGTVPDQLCNLFSSIFGCAGLLCPAGTFHPDGAANERGACRPCNDINDDDDDDFIPVSSVLGRLNCETINFINGDMNGDGKLNEREVLRLIFAATDGPNWGEGFNDWAHMEINKCDLTGVNCKDNSVTKIDLREASLCSEVARNDAGAVAKCPGLPPELGRMAHLEVLDLSRSTFLQGTLPTEIGMLKKLRVLDLSSCTSMRGTIPSEIGMAVSLRVLNLSESSFSGTLPDTIGNLQMLEKINLGLNPFHGSLPSTLGGLKSIREILLSRAHLTGTMPSALGDLPLLENLELYSNGFVGPIPDMRKSTSLKRIDCFNNNLSGQFPSSLASLHLLQIVHMKNNHISGTLPEDIGKLPLLSWLDVSNNLLVGTIPASMGTISSLRDIRLGGNKLHGPVPETLCSNPQINGGRVPQYDCDVAICPLGTYSQLGFASESDGGECIKCPEGETNQYLGSRVCRTFTQRDFLFMFFDAMGGVDWSEDKKRGWQDKTVPECEWTGVSCDEDGNVDGLAFPISGSIWDLSAY